MARAAAINGTAVAVFSTRAPGKSPETAVKLAGVTKSLCVDDFVAEVAVNVNWQLPRLPWSASECVCQFVFLHHGSDLVEIAHRCGIQG